MINMKIAMLYAHWEDFGETWSTPRSWRSEFEFRGHEVEVYNLYAHNGEIIKKNSIRQYSELELIRLYNEIKNGKEVDIIYLLDYGPFQSLKLSKQYFPNQILIKESGDEPQSHRMHLQTAKQFDIVLSPDWQCVERYQNMGINAKWQTHFADERIFFPKININIEYDCVTTCGSRGNGLTEKIKAALGNKFENSRYYYGEDHPKQLCKGMMVFQRSQFGEITRRIFEGMACGRMVITDRLPEETHINDLFTDGKDIVFYDDADDAIQKIQFYASHTREREAIAKAGYLNVMENHTVSARVDALEDFIEEVKRERFNQ